jgi:hypothetical protein
MPYLLRFATEHVYDSTLEGITLEVFLNAGGGEPVRLRAKVDTGASDLTVCSNGSMPIF